MYYRPEIDGLRSLAILPVLFFHAEYAWMPGGFLGVDVFFVISGYLISSILIKEANSGALSLALFYERRARRILPALFFVLGVSYVGAWWVLSPHALIDFAKSLIASVSFVANFYFWLTSNYFNADTHLKPLVHIWSLGIEEQFYFIFPLLFLLFWRVKRLFVWLLVVGFGLSFGYAHYLSQWDANSSFYLLPSRAWELLIGAFCAAYLSYKTHPPLAYAQVGSVLGLILILGSMLFMQPSYAHPDFITLAPTVGAALIILCASPATWTARFLSHKLLVGIGLLSYSLYLWHQPLFAFALHLTSQSVLQPWLSLTLIGISVVLAYISWRWVEKPFRNRQFLTQKSVFLLSLAAILLSCALSAVLILNHGFPQRFHQSVQRILQFESYPYSAIYRENTCFLNEHQQAHDFAAECLISAQQPALIWGDSHAAALSFGLRQHNPQWAQLNASGCPPLALTDISWRPFCADINRFVLEQIEAHQPSHIVLEANWGLYALDDLTQRLQTTLELVHQLSPSSRLYVLGDLPQWQPSLLTLLQHNPSRFTVDRTLKNDSLAQTRLLDQQLRTGTESARHAAPAQKNWAHFISLESLLCQEAQCTAVVSDAAGEPVPMAWDYGHPTAEGSVFLAQQLRQSTALDYPTP